MVQGKDFLYFLYNKATLEFYYVDDYMNVLTTTTPRPIKIGPDGWQEMSIAEEMSEKYWGFNREFTIPLNWVEDAAAIIKHIMYRVGYEAKLWVLITEQKLQIVGNKYKYYHDLLYRGELDLSTFSHKGPKVTANCVDGGLAAAIKAKESTMFQIPVNTPDAVNIQMDGIPLHETANFILPDLDIQKTLTGTNFWVPLVLVGREGTSTGIDFKTVNLATTPSALPDRVKSDEWFMRSQINNPNVVLPNFVSNIKFRILKNNIGAIVRFRIIKSSTTFANQSDYDLTTTFISGNSPTLMTPGNIYSLNLNRTIAILPGETFYLEGIIVGGAPGAIDFNFEFLDKSTLDIEYKNTYKLTYIKGRYPFDVFAELIKQATDGKYQIFSTFLSGLKQVVHSCGDAVRGIENPFIKTSIQDFYQAYNVRWNLGMCIIQDKATLEEKEFFVVTNPADDIDLGEVSDLEVACADNLAFSNLLIGWDKQDTDIVNGKQEPNTTLKMSPPSERVPKDFILTSSYRTDATGIEELRINKTGKKTTDDSSDNDNVLLHITKAPVAYFTADNAPIYGLDRTLNAGATGLTDPEGMFNLYFSPKRCFNAWAWYFHSVLPAGSDGQLYKFRDLDKNQDMIAAGVVEKADVQVELMPDRKFLPFYFIFETRVPENYLSLITVNPIRSFKFTYNGVSMRGIGKKSSQEPGTNRAQTYTLLAAATNNISDLEKINS